MEDSNSFSHLIPYVNDENLLNHSPFMQSAQVVDSSHADNQIENPFVPIRNNKINLESSRCKHNRIYSKIEANEKYAKMLDDSPQNRVLSDSNIHETTIESIGYQKDDIKLYKYMNVQRNRKAGDLENFNEGIRKCFESLETIKMLHENKHISTPAPCLKSFSNKEKLYSNMKNVPCDQHLQGENNMTQKIRFINDYKEDDIKASCDSVACASALNGCCKPLNFESTSLSTAISTIPPSLKIPCNHSDEEPEEKGAWECKESSIFDMSSVDAKTDKEGVEEFAVPSQKKIYVFKITFGVILFIICATFIYIAL